MLDKKAQSGIITTILIILLVLAAIVIVWQVVQGTIRGGSEQIEKQAGCIGTTLEVEKSAANTFAIKRSGGGKITPEPSIRAIADGVTASCTWSPVDPDWTEDFTSAKCTLATDPTKSFEAALVLSDGTVCPITGKWTV